MIETKKWRISLPHVVLGLLGLAIAYYSMIVKQRIDANADTGCGFSESINCDAVIGSSTYGTLFGLPWGIWGMAFFAVVLLLAVNGKTGNEQAGNRSSTQILLSEAAWRLGAATVGLLTSLALIYISKVKIGVWCPVCMATHATTFMLFVVSVVMYFRTQRMHRSQLNSETSKPI